MRKPLAQRIAEGLPGPCSRWARTRVGRKFLRDRVAITASLVIAAYIAVGLFVLLGGVSAERCNAQIGAVKLPGFGLEPPAVIRRQHAESALSRVDSAMQSSDPKTRLQNLTINNRAFDQSLELSSVSAKLDRAFGLYDALAIADEELEADPELLAKLEELESMVDGFLVSDSKAGSWSRNLELCLGTDTQGRSIFLRTIFSIKVAVQIGLVTALVSTLIGSLMGAAAGYYGGWVDHLVTWIYSTFSSIPNLVFLVVLAYAFSSLDMLVMGRPIDQTLIPVYIAFCATFWIGPCRVIRGETMKIRELEYVQAAVANGFSSVYILLRHVLPNTVHLMLINFSLLLIGAIKSEVILSYLGLGVQPGAGASWGIMIRDSKSEVLEAFFWQIGSASLFMFVFVLAFNLLSDALQDAFDPKHV